MFSHLSPYKPHMMCAGNPQNSVCFFKTIDLRCHTPRFTLKINVFLSISLETTKMSVEILRTVLIFFKTIDLSGHMPRFTAE